MSKHSVDIRVIVHPCGNSYIHTNGDFKPNCDSCAVSDHHTVAGIVISSHFVTLGQTSGVEQRRW